MWEKNLGRRIVLIVVVLLLGTWFLWPPKQKLRGGLDIAGGVSMIYEINETPGQEQDIAEEMKSLLQKRVDPDGVYGLTWRVIGRNRIEIQMPLADESLNKMTRDFQAAQDALFAENIKRSEIEAVFQMDAGGREARARELARGSATREKHLSDAAAAYDAYRAALAAQAAHAATQPASSEPEDAAVEDRRRALSLAVRDAEEALADAVDRVLDTNINPTMFKNVLDLEQGTAMRETQLKDLKATHATLAGKIDAAVAAYDRLRKNRTRLDSPEDLQRLIKGAGTLDFRILAETDPQNPAKYDTYRQQLQTRGPRIPPGETSFGWFRIDNPGSFFDKDTAAELAAFDPKTSPFYVAEKYGDEYYVLAKISPRDTLLTNMASGAKWRLVGARVDRDQRGLLAVTFQFDPPGGQLFGQLTGDNVGKQLCIFLDDVAYSAANINSKINEFGEISSPNGFSVDKVNYLVQTMQAGALPARLKDTPLSERTIEARLGQDNLNRSMKAALISLAAVTAFMLIYYRVGGGIAVLAMLMNVFLTLAAMAYLRASFTMAGIAGVILVIGMSVDANVLIFERMREEKARGSSLRMLIKNGYDKAFLAIFDSNITTLLSAVILYYVGSEEVRGFGLTLGWGIVISMFTSLFVTRTLFAVLVKYDLIKTVNMMSLIPTPSIDWYSLRKYFIPASITLTVLGLVTLFTRSARDMFDVEFLGGVSAVVEVKDRSANGDYIVKQMQSVAKSLEMDSAKLANVTVTPVAGEPNAFQISAGDIPADRLAAIITEPLESLFERGGVDETAGPNMIRVRLSSTMSAEELAARVRELQKVTKQSAEDLARMDVNSVVEGDEARKGLLYNVVTVETNKRLVQHALVSALGDKLNIQPKISYRLRLDGDRPFAITQRRLESVVPLPEGVGADVTDFVDGAAMVFEDVRPPQTLATLTERLRNMRLQPGYQDYPDRVPGLVGIKPEGVNDKGVPLFSSFAVLVADENYAYSDNPEAWLTQFASKELELTKATFDTQQSLQKVTQFKKQISGQSQNKAIMALVLSWLVIILFMWIRFGTAIYGVAGVVALVHDIAMVLAFLTFASVFGGADTILGKLFLLTDFKIDMTIVAAFLTIVGYSVNDTIVIFDRIRETRGRLGIVTPEVLNRAINQCMSRTLLTGLTTLFVITIMYIFGGASIRGFNFCLLIGILTGTYSSFAVAAPLLLYGKEEPATGPATAAATA